ncbi:MAG TPA: glycosyltransferase family 2 protein [Thermoanaerobaculia bacterium]|nr:glycosyltransferase family 2 protein [Thermoanaerobaculia bacterium]
MRRRGAPQLPPPRLPPATTILLPVRNERHNVLECVETLLAQGEGDPRVRVIDDGSTDGTASLVATRAAGEPRLTLLSAGPLPAGWRGKLHALWVGLRGVETPWVLLTDADTRHAPGLLARAHAAAAERRLDAVSLAGHQEVRGPGENLLIPLVFALLDALLGDWEAAADGAAGAPVANGQFILLRREAWEAAGGFEPIRDEPIDDVAIVSRLRAHGFRTAFLRSGGLSVRMYRGGAEAFRGWRRNLGGLFGLHPGTAARLLALLLLPPLVLLAELLGGFWGAAALLWSAGAASSMLLRHGGGHAPAWGLLYPLDALSLAGVLFLGVLDRRRGKLASWKGREMKV